MKQRLCKLCLLQEDLQGGSFSPRSCAQWRMRERKQCTERSSTGANEDRNHRTKRETGRANFPVVGEDDAKKNGSMA